MLLCSFCNRVNVYQHIVALIGIVCFSFEHVYFGWRRIGSGTETARSVV